MPEYPTNPKYQARQHDDLAAFIEETAIHWALPEELLTGAKRRVAERLADRLEADNPRFEREEFLEACGVRP